MIEVVAGSEFYGRWERTDDEKPNSQEAHRILSAKPFTAGKKGHIETIEIKTPGNEGPVKWARGADRKRKETLRHEEAHRI